MSNDSIKVTVRLPEVIVEKNKENGKLMGKNQTDSIVMAVNLTAIVLSAHAQGKKILIHDEATGKSEVVVFI